MSTAISISGLVKTFGPTRALDGLDLEVRTGEVHGFLGRLRGGLDPRRRAELLEVFDLDPRKKARSYSKGNRQKVALVAALASDVELLLDEPTAGRLTQVGVRSLVSQPPTLEELFLRHYQTEKPVDAAQDGGRSGVSR
jgi:ABC-type multidrug transport system ATPase subunit